MSHDGDSAAEPSSNYVHGMELLVDASAELSMARDLGAVQKCVRNLARELTGADGATFVLREGDYCYYADEDAIEPLWKGRRFPLETCISGWVMMHREGVVIEDIYQDERIPVDAYRPTFVKSLAMVPIRTRDPIGAIGNYWASPHTATREQVKLLRSLADLTSVAIENVKRVGELERLAARDRFLSEAATLLSHSLDYQETLSNVGRLVVPHLADWYAVDLIDGDTVEMVAVAHQDPQKVELAREVRRRWGVNLDPVQGVGKVIHTGLPDRAEVSEALLVAGARDEEHLRFARELRLKSYITVPLSGDREIIGALTLVTTEESGRVLDQGDQDTAVELAQRCAIAIEKARLYARAQEAIRARDEFLSIASHELRTPLTPLQIQLKILEEKVTTIAREDQDLWLRKRLRTLDRQSHRLQRLVEQMLDVSRIVGGRLALDIEPCDLVAIVSDVVAEMGLAEDSSQGRVLLDMPASLPGRWDRLRLERVIANLLGNALKYGEKRPVEIRLRSDTRVATVEVQDHGIGIDDADQSRIFRRFERAVSSRNYGGLGVGLFISSQFVEAMGGTISVTSQPGQGSTFRIDLPLHAHTRSGDELQ